MGGRVRDDRSAEARAPRDARLKAALRANLRRRKGCAPDDPASSATAASDPDQPDAGEAGRPGAGGRGENGGS